MSESVFERARRIMSRELGVPEARITPQTAFADLDDPDSLAMTEMLMALEEEFSISMPQEEVEKLKTVGETVCHIEAKLNTAAA